MLTRDRKEEDAAKEAKDISKVCDDRMMRQRPTSSHDFTQGFFG